MNAHIVFGLFAFYVAAMYLWLVLSGRQESVLALLRQIWGRTLGHFLYFATRVALPILLCVVCLGWGIRQYDVSGTYFSLDAPPQLNVEYYRNLLQLSKKEKSHDPLGVVYGA